MQRSKEVDKYLKSVPENCRVILNEVRDIIFEIAGNEPEMEEVFAYQIAVYKFRKKPIFSIAGFKDHCSFITQDKEIAEKTPELKSYEISGTSIHFSAQKPLTKELISKIIELRLADRKKEGR